MTNRIAAAILQLGMIAVALVVLPYRLFELDRYFVPKELALHVAALIAGALLLRRRRTFDTADLLFAAFLAWSAVSALFASNHWLAQRALGVSVSSAMIFWAARRLGVAGMYRRLLLAAALASVVAVTTGLAQAYGMTSDYFSFNRAPGGTFGNRNFVAHFAVIGLPSLVYAALTARRLSGALAACTGVAAVAAFLVLSRTRAAWLALIVSAACAAVPMMVSRKYWRTPATSGRLGLLTLAAAVGACVAIALPNRLRWTSDSPYLETARSVVDYSSGSGRGRLAQYQNSMRMAIAHPLLGVGPGNWPVRYVRFAPSSDASIASNGMTANPWPSSDWVAFVSERGVVAAIAIAGVLIVLGLNALRRWRELPDVDSVVAKVALVATVAALLVVSAFDAVLLLAAPSLLAWCIIGAAAGAGETSMDPGWTRPRWMAAWMVAYAIVALSVARSGAQTAAIVTVGEGGSRAGWIQAAALDPGSYRIELRVAQLYAARGRCSSARLHARRAVSLFPYAAEAKRLLRTCGG